MVNVKQIVKEILSGRNNFCCLCLETSQDMYYVNDEVFLTQVISLKLSDIITNVLSDQNVKNSLMTDESWFCHNCVNSILSFYKFTEKCKDNLQHLSNALQRLNEHFDGTIGVEEFNCTYVYLNTEDLSLCKYYYQKEKTDTDFTVVDGSSKVCTDDKQSTSFDSELDQDEVVTDKKSKWKSNPIPLSEIMCDENSSVYKCKKCMKEFPQVQNLRQHYVRSHAPKQFHCDQCSRSYGSKSILKTHQVKSHSSVVCAECGKVCTNRHTLRYHERSHLIRLTCSSCGKVYKSKKSYNHHVKNNLCLQPRKSNAEAKFICNYCDKRYSQKALLSVHIKLDHLNGAGFVCQWCNKKYGSQSKLREHVVTHTKEKRFACDLCSLRFVSSSSLLYHKRIHTGERPYQCQECQKSFVCASRRSEHMRREHLPRAFQCDICCKMFKDRRDLKYHKIRHYNPIRLRTSANVCD